MLKNAWPSSVGIHLVGVVDADGALNIYGTLTMNGTSVDDGTSNTVLIGEAPPRVSCADTDGDGVAGITALELVGRDPQSGEELLVFFLGGRDLDERGDYSVWVRVGNLASEITLALLPLPAGPPAGGER